MMAKPRNPSLGQASDFDTRLLCIFKIIVECGSLFVTESTLDLSRSAIDLRTGGLEKRLDMHLCQHGYAGFALADEGHEVYHATQTLLAALERFRAEVNDLHQHLCGELNISIINSLAILPQVRIAHALSALEGQEPRVQIGIGMTTLNEVKLDVLNGHLHVDVAPLISPLSELEHLPLYDEHAQPCCSRGHTPFKRADGDIAVNEVLAADVVAPDYRLPVEAQACYQELNNSANASDREDMASLILTDNLIGYLPLHRAADWVAAGMLRPLLPERFHYAIVLIIITRKRRRSNLVPERLLEATAVSWGRRLNDAGFGHPPNGVFSLIA